MIKKMVIALTNFNEDADFVFVKIEGTQEQYEDGEFYETAKTFAKQFGLGEMVVYNEDDPPKFLFDHFEWDTASIVPVTEPTFVCRYFCYKCGKTWQEENDSAHDSECTCGARAVSCLMYCNSNQDWTPEENKRWDERQAVNKLLDRLQGTT
jgi:hypothetical protein